MRADLGLRSKSTMDRPEINGGLTSRILAGLAGGQGEGRYGIGVG